VDLESGAVVAVTLQGADEGDTTSIFETLEEAEAVSVEIGTDEVKEVVTDKGYHSDAVCRRLLAFGKP
jgi:transposase